MPSSSTDRGAYFKGRSKDWLQRAGFTVFDMELIRVNHTPMGMVPVKRDQLGSDLAYLTRRLVVFVQVKSGAQPLATYVRQARLAFADYRFPDYSGQELHVWRPRAHAPVVVRWWRGRDRRQPWQ